MIWYVHRLKRELGQSERRVSLLPVVLGREGQARDLGDHPAQDAPHAPGPRPLQAEHTLGLSERRLDERL